MNTHLINRIVIALGQYRQFGKQAYMNEAVGLVNRLAAINGITQDQAMDLLEQEVSR